MPFRTETNDAPRAAFACNAFPLPLYFINVFKIFKFYENFMNPKHVLNMARKAEN